MILSLVSQKGGAAKSTLAVSIACELHARGHKVLLVDCDPQQTVTDVANVAAEAGRAGPTITQMGKYLWKPDQLPQLAQSFDHVVIDTPGRLGDVQNAALMVSDLALIPIGQSAAELWALNGTIDVVKDVADKKAMFGGTLTSAVVVTRKTPRTTLGKAIRETLREAGLQLLSAETTHRIAWQECLGAGQGVAQYAPKDVAAKELNAIVNELLALHESTTTTTNLEAANG